ncbi:MAG: GNAT family N-acetyltransferase [Myxococcales bacterium]|nr:GNAT family N-acetyltransferase [Myxococcales bacterium]
MNIRSLGLRSDLALIAGEFIQRDDCLVVRSPNEPNYYWGNLLVFSKPPTEECKSTWERRFAEEFADMPEVRHKAFTWDMGGKGGSIRPFVESGYHHQTTVVLTAESVKEPPRPNAGMEIRELSSDAEWNDIVALQVASRDPEHSEASYLAFAQQRFVELRAMVERGEGEWYGGYVDGRQVGNLGVFRSGTIARFQQVVTCPDFRRKGVCGTLVSAVSNLALARVECQTLVMLADTEYHAARIYESVGFGATENIEGLCLWPPTGISCL